MSHHSEGGATTLGFVLLLLLLGSFMLQGLQQQLTQQRTQIISEIDYLKQYSAAMSALAWGTQLSWQQKSGWQCQGDQAQGWTACLLTLEKGETILAARGVAQQATQPVTLWRWGKLEQNSWRAQPHGWLDYCPFAREAQCQLPK